MYQRQRKQWNESPTKAVGFFKQFPSALLRPYGLMKYSWRSAAVNKKTLKQCCHKGMYGHFKAFHTPSRFSLLDSNLFSFPSWSRQIWNNFWCCRITIPLTPSPHSWPHWIFACEGLKVRPWRGIANELPAGSSYKQRGSVPHFFRSAHLEFLLEAINLIF